MRIRGWTLELRFLFNPYIIKWMPIISLFNIYNEPVIEWLVLRAKVVTHYDRDAEPVEIPECLKIRLQSFGITVFSNV